MKLGSKKASPLNGLDNVFLPNVAEYASDEEVAKAKAQPLDDEELPPLNCDGCYVVWCYPSGIKRAVVEQERAGGRPAHSDSSGRAHRGRWFFGCVPLGLRVVCMKAISF